MSRNIPAPEAKLIFINLTNGLELLPGISGEIEFIRIQSSLCEAKNWSQIIEDLDYNFLINLAQGKECLILDCSQRGGESRAIWQGVQWIRYAVNRAWFDIRTESWTRSHNSTEYFKKEYEKLSKRAKRKLRYIKKFLNCFFIKLYAYGGWTEHDGDYEYFRKILKENGKCQ